MIIADEEELELLRQIFRAQKDENMIEAPKAERKLMLQIASTMKAKDYLVLPLEEQRKWYLEWNPLIDIEEVPMQRGLTKKMYLVPCGFRPWEVWMGNPNRVF